MDTFCYERQHGADMEVGSYAHRAILHEPEEIPSIEQAKLSPTEMPFTMPTTSTRLEQAYELMPELLGAEGAEMRYAINGLLLADLRRQPDPWARATSRDSGPRPPSGSRRSGRRPRGRRVDDPRALEIDIHHSGIAALPPHQMRREHTRLRTTERSSRPTGSSTRPSSTSPTATSGGPYASPEEARRDVLRDRGLGAAALVQEIERRPARGVRRRRHAAEHVWDARWWSPIINAEHLRCARPPAMVDLTAFEVFDIAGPGLAGHRARSSPSATSRSAR